MTKAPCFCQKQRLIQVMFWHGGAEGYLASGGSLKQLQVSGLTSAGPMHHVQDVDGGLLTIGATEVPLRARCHGNPSAVCTPDLQVGRTVRATEFGTNAMGA